MFLSSRVLVLVAVGLFQLVSGQDDTAERTVAAGDLGNIIGLKPYTTTTPLRPFYMFHSIPYAKPTGGANRFKPSELRTGPLTNNPETPFLALSPLNACPQGGIFDLGKFDIDDGASGETNLLKLFKQNKWKFNMNPTPSASKTRAPIPGSDENEDTCLVLNVNTPKIPRTSEDFENLLPVIFFIHGGSSTSAWGAPFNGFRLMSRDVVLVSINYRLGVLGAFNLGTDDAPGNAAMYDSITALQWVQKYIHHFGGDPKRVTVYGHSAGSMMASHLLLSPLAKGLISGIIGASGSALAVWGTSVHPSIDKHLKVAEHAGCYDGTSPVNKPEIVKCMQEAPVDTLLQALDKYSGDEEAAGGLGFDAKSPSIQSPDLTIPIFLAKSPAEILANGEQNNVPVIMGAMRHDGSFALEGIYDSYLKDKIDDEEWMRNELLPALFNVLRMEDRSGVFQHTIGLTYMGEAHHSTNFWEKLPGLIDIVSVFGFKAGSYRLVEQHAKINPKSFYYAFEHQGFWSTYDMSGLSPIPGGVAHTDDMLYPFQAFPLITKGDLGVANRMIDYFVNFATSGDPNIGLPVETRFPAFNPSTHEFLIINKTDAIAQYCRDTWAGNSLEIAALDKLPTQPIGVKV